MSRAQAEERACEKALERALVACVAALLVWSSATSASAEVTTLHSFDAPLGENISALTDTHDGNRYATTRSGGTADLGTILRRDRSGRLTVLYTFDGTQGAEPVGLTLGADDALFGVTSRGGAHGYGTAFRITRSGELTTLHSFSLAEGGPPKAALVRASDGNFYGTTAGVYVPQVSPPMLEIKSRGAIFRMNPQGSVTTLHELTGSEGAQPQAALIQARDGHLYGTTSQLLDRTYPHPTTISWGTVFRITRSGELTTLHTFDGLEGGDPKAPLIEAPDGTLYGTTPFATQWQWPGTHGSVFSITPSGRFSVLHTFDSDSPEGSDPQTGLAFAEDGNLYGATHSALFRITPTGSLTVLRAFMVEDTAPLNVTMQRGDDGQLYGATRNSLFRATTRGRFTTLARVGYVDGADPQGGVVLARDGSFYGTTTAGGAYGGGTLFRLTRAGALRVLHTFAPNELPGELVEGTDGALYGATSWGGADRVGSIFRMTRHGSYRTLYSFAGSSRGLPFGALAQVEDGRFYGVTMNDGGDYRGTLFQIDTRGRFGTVHVFEDSVQEPGQPQTGPTLGEDGALYGTTGFGAQSEIAGTVYRVTTDGQYSVLHAFTRDEGASPNGLSVGDDGALYGVTEAGGPSEGGTVFRTDPSGTTATLHAFQYQDANEGSSPRSALTLGADDQWYGSTTTGGAHNRGTLFRLSSTGSLTTLYSFSELDNAYGETSTLILGTDGALYGTHTTEGALHRGAILRVTNP